MASLRVRHLWRTARSSTSLRMSLGGVPFACAQGLLRGNRSTGSLPDPFAAPNPSPDLRLRRGFPLARAGAEGVAGGVRVAFHDVYGIMIVGRAPAGAGGVHVSAVGQGLIEHGDIFEPAAGVRRVAVRVALLEDGGGGIEADRFELALPVIGDLAERHEGAGGIGAQDDPAIVGDRADLQVAVAARDRAVWQADREAHVPAARHAGEGGIDAGVEV